MYVINEKDVGYVKIFKDELKNVEDFANYKNCFNAKVEREGTADEYVVFNTFKLSKAIINKKSYLLQERNSWYETASAINLGVFSSIENALKAAKKEYGELRQDGSRFNYEPIKNPNDVTIFIIEFETDEFGEV